MAWLQGHLLKFETLKNVVCLQDPVSFTELLLSANSMKLSSCYVTSGNVLVSRMGRTGGFSLSDNISEDYHYCCWNVKICPHATSVNF